MGPYLFIYTFVNMVKRYYQRLEDLKKGKLEFGILAFCLEEATKT